MYTGLRRSVDAGGAAAAIGAGDGTGAALGPARPRSPTSTSTVEGLISPRSRASRR